MRSQALKFSTGYRLQWEQAQDCHVLLYPEGMIKLNTAAGEILNLVDGKRDVEEIVTLLEQKFPGADIRSDVREFVATARGNRWIE